MDTKTSEIVNPEPRDWPKFEIGEEFELKNVIFTLTRINESTIVLRPKVHGESARTVIEKIT